MNDKIFGLQAVVTSDIYGSIHWQLHVAFTGTPELETSQNVEVAFGNS